MDDFWKWIPLASSICIDSGTIFFIRCLNLRMINFLLYKDRVRDKPLWYLRALIIMLKMPMSATALVFVFVQLLWSLFSKVQNGSCHFNSYHVPAIVILQSWCRHGLYAAVPHLSWHVLAAIAWMWIHWWHSNVTCLRRLVQWYGLSPPERSLHIWTCSQ